MTGLGGGVESSGLHAVGVRVARLSEDEVVVKRGLAEVRLAAPGVAGLVERLVRNADGSRVAEELTADLQSEYDYADRVVQALLRREILHPAGDSGPQARFWASVLPGEFDLPSRLRAQAVRVTGDGGLADALRNALQDNGIRVSETDDDDPAEPPALWCASGVAGAVPDLLAASRQALAAGTPFLPVWVEDLLGRVGPLTHPHDTACLRCYLWRLESNDPWRDARRLLRDGSAADAGWLPHLVTTLAGIAAGEVTMHLAGLPVRVIGRVAEVNPVPFAVTVRAVLKVPRCPDCSPSAQRGDPVSNNESQLTEPAP